MSLGHQIAARLALASASTLALSAAAQAQTHNWTGFYAGVNAGGAWGRSNVDTAVSCSPVTGFITYFDCPAPATTAAQVSAVGTGAASGGGFTGGVQAGYNWQNGSVVLGLEADIEAFRIKASRQASGIYPGPAMSSGPYTISSSIDTNWLFTARGRLGWAFGDVLAYVTGGLAVTDLRTSHTFTDDFTFGGFATSGASGTWGGSSTRVGWALGAGAEWALNRNWSVKAEYLYLDFGSISAAGQITHTSAGIGYANAISTSADLTAHIARAGINYKF
jgi:outer membrane immunogenic protein